MDSDLLDPTLGPFLVDYLESIAATREAQGLDEEATRLRDEVARIRAVIAASDPDRVRSALATA